MCTRCLILALSWGSTVAAAPAANPFDLQGLVDRAIARGDNPIVIPPGQYRVAPRNREHLRLDGLHDVTIDATGAELVCLETTRAITITGCRNLTLRGLTIDHDPLPFTQGRIVAVSDDKLIHEIELFDGYPPATEATNRKYEIFRPDTRTLRFGDYFTFSVKAVSPRRLRITKAEAYRRRPAPEEVGDIIAIDTRHAPGGSIPHAVFLSDSIDCTLEDVTLYSENVFGFFESECDGTVYRRCDVDRRPAETDLIPRGDLRIRSLNADAFHSKRAVRGPSYLSCRAQFQGDDCVAINGDYHLVTSADGAVLRVLGKGRGGVGLAPGDPVELVSYTGERLADAQVVAVEADGEPTDAERAWLSKQRMDARLKAKPGPAARVTLDRPVDLPCGSVIAAANRIGNGFRIVDGEYGYNRSRGLMIKAGQGEIRGNRIAGCWGEAIKLAPEWWWLEAGSGSDVSITGNTITACETFAIAVYAHGGNGTLAPPGAHRNITIVNNQVSGCPLPGIVVTSTNGLRLDENTVVPDGNRVVPAGDLRRCQITEPTPIALMNTEE